MRRPRQAEELRVHHVGGNAGADAAVHFDAVEGAPVGLEGVAGDFGALESGLFAEVFGDIGVGVDLVEPLHLAAVGAVGEVVLPAVAEFQEEQENQQDVRLSGRQGLTAPGGEERGGKQRDDGGQDDAVVGGKGQLVGEDQRPRRWRG